MLLRATTEDFPYRELVYKNQERRCFVTALMHVDALLTGLVNKYDPILKYSVMAAKSIIAKTVFAMPSSLVSLGFIATSRNLCQ